MASRGMQLFLGASALALVVVVALPADSADGTPTAAAASLPADWPSGAPEDTGRPTAVDEPAVLDAAARSAMAAHLANLTWGRDPFLPPDRVHVYVEPEPEPEPIAAGLELPALTGISRRGSSVMAILGEQIVEPGDAAGAGFVVLTIEAGSVTLLRDGEQHILTLSGGR